MSEDRYYDKCESLKQLTQDPDWDADGAKPTDPKVLDDARRIAGALDDIYGEAFIAPCGDGSVHLNYTLSAAAVSASRSGARED